MSVQASPRRRTSASAAPQKTVKTSVPLDVETHAKLCGLAALKGVDRSAMAAEFIRVGLRGVVLFDKRGGSDHVEDSDRREGRSSATESDDEAA
jgi:hypothetical protein